MGSTLKTSEVLRNAAEHVGSGWCQGYWEVGGRVCLVEAILRAAHKAEDDKAAPLPVVRLLDQVIQHFYPNYREAFMAPSQLQEALVQWNDTRERTQDEVIAMLEIAASLAEHFERQEQEEAQRLYGYLSDMRFWNVVQQLEMDEDTVLAGTS